MQDNLIRLIKITLVGGFIGLVSLIPGTSGGTVVVIAGVYDDLVTALRGLSRRVEWRRQLFFLLPLAAGCVATVLPLARIIERMLSIYPNQMGLFFVGLIVGTVPFLYRRAVQKKFRPIFLLPMAVCFIMVILLVINQPEEATPSLLSLDAINVLKVFGAGFVSAATGLIIPGISGSMVLLITGMYSTLITAIRDFNFIILLVLGLGALAGLFSFPHLIYYLLQRFYQWTYFAIIGLVMGSAANIWPGLSPGFAGFADGLILLAGFCLAMFFHSSSGRINKREAAING